MTVAAAAVWCVTCGGVPDVAVTVERRGTMMHYGACWQHVTSVAERARLDVERIDRADIERRFAANEFATFCRDTRPRRPADELEP